jgi:thioredoxin-related protein
MPIKNKYLATSIIYCLDCNSKMKRVMDGKNLAKYICSNYAIYRNCKRNGVAEKDIRYLLKNHFLLHGIEEEVNNDTLIKLGVEIHANTDHIKITFKDDKIPTIVSSPNLLKFVE